jgi:DNA-binding IclR family transcriptional regulator
MKTRSKGYGVSWGELFDIIAAVSFPVRDDEGKVVGALIFRARIDDTKRLMNESTLAEIREAMDSFGL